MGAGGFMESEMVNATADLLPRLAGNGPVTLEPARSPVSSPLRGWYDDKPVYLRGEPEVISEDCKTIRRWHYRGYLVTIVSDFSRAPREIDRSIEISDAHQAGDGCSVGGN